MSRNLHFTDCEAPLSRNDADEERISKSSCENVNSYLRLPQTQSKSSNSINSDGIISEQVATGFERSETSPHSNIQTTGANDSASYLPDICLQVSGIESSDNGIRTCSKDREDVVLNSNVLFNLKRRPQSAQPTSRSSMSRQSPSAGNMESGAPLLGAIFNRLRPATASAIRCMENSVLRSRLDQVKATIRRCYSFPLILSQVSIQVLTDYLMHLFPSSHRLSANQ